MTTQTSFPRFQPKLEIHIAPHYMDIYNKYKAYSMVADKPQLYIENLVLMEFFGNSVKGDFIECGTWKGGMSCGMMSVGGKDRSYHFFDSFEGLPEPKEIDGKAAFEYQENTDSPLYHNNCTADYDNFINLVHSQNIPKEQIHVYKGWFEDRMPDYPGRPISVLRLDGDWYESTLTCLNALYKFVAIGGIILLDDYDAWEGCAQATHEFLGTSKACARIMRTPLTQIAYIQKLET